MACPPCPVEKFIRPLAHSIVSGRPPAEPARSIPSEYFGAPASTSWSLTMTVVPSMNTRFLPRTLMPAYSPPARLTVPSPSKQPPLMMHGDRHDLPVVEVLVMRTPSCELRSVEQPTSLVASPNVPLWSMTQPLPAHRSARHPT